MTHLATRAGIVEPEENPKELQYPEDREYMGYVKQLPCCICEAYGEPYGQAPSDAHHTIHGRYSQSRSPDALAIPLCKGHHQTGEHGKIAIHLGKKTWRAKYGSDTDFISTTQDAVEAQFGYTPKPPIERN